MYKYKFILYWSDENRAFVAEVPELFGYRTHDDTRETALNHITKRWNFGLTPRERSAIQYQNPEVSI